MPDADARRLYVDVAEPLAERAAISISTVDSDQEPWFRSWAPSSAARSLSEAEGRLEQELASGNRVVVAFEHRGDAERARYNLERLDGAGSSTSPSRGDPLGGGRRARGGIEGGAVRRGDGRGRASSLRS